MIEKWILYSEGDSSVGMSEEIMEVFVEKDKTHYNLLFKDKYRPKNTFKRRFKINKKLKEDNQIRSYLQKFSVDKYDKVLSNKESSIDYEDFYDYNENEDFYDDECDN